MTYSYKVTHHPGRGFEVHSVEGEVPEGTHEVSGHVDAGTGHHHIEVHHTHHTGREAREGHAVADIEPDEAEAGSDDAE